MMELIYLSPEVKQCSFFSGDRHDTGFQHFPGQNGILGYFADCVFDAVSIKSSVLGSSFV